MKKFEKVTIEFEPKFKAEQKVWFTHGVNVKEGKIFGAFAGVKWDYTGALQRHYNLQDERYYIEYHIFCEGKYHMIAESNVFKTKKEAEKTLEINY